MYQIFLFIDLTHQHNLMKKRALIIGSFGGNNFGDNLVLESIIEILPNNIEFIVPTHNPKFINEKYNNSHVKAININIKESISFRFLSFNLLKELKNIDLILTTAGIFFDQKLYNPRFNFISSLLPILFYSKNLKIPVIGFGVGVTKHSSYIGKQFLKKTLDLHDLLILRDKDSYNYVKSLDKNIDMHCKSDIAHSLLSKFDENERKKDFGIGINVASYLKGTYSGKKIVKNSDDWISEFSIFVSQLYKNHNVKFFATTKTDYELNNLIIKKAAINTSNIELYNLSVDECVDQLESISVAIGSRMHFCILATSLGIPTIALSYHPKVASYIESLNIDGYIFNIEDPNYSEVQDKIEEIYDNYHGISAKLKEQIKIQQSNSRESVDLIKAYTN
jgi:polysaccharide pyruvyl transferase WcaK-like protein